MPSLTLATNFQITDPKEFALELSKFGAEVLKKPEQYISVAINLNETLTFAGTFDPAFNLRIESLDNLNPQANGEYSKAFAKFFQQKLGVPSDRGYINFYDPGRAFIGYEGTTFDTIFPRSE